MHFDDGSDGDDADLFAAGAFLQQVVALNELASGHDVRSAAVDDGAAVVADVVADGDAAGDDDDYELLAAMACCGHCVANATYVADQPDGHDDVVHGPEMPPTVLAVCE